MRAMLAENWDTQLSLHDYVKNDRFVFEQKLDGHRVLLHVNNGFITARNRNGEISQHNPMMQEVAWRLNFKGLQKRSLILDGELIGDTLHVFDVPMMEGIVNPNHPHARRKAILDELFDVGRFNKHFQLVSTATGRHAKASLTVNCKNQGSEGIMIKDSTHRYVEGRSRGMMKVKFTKDADFVVTRTNEGGKVNATLSAYDDTGVLVDVGRCSLIGKEDIESGDVVEVRYLYVTENMRLYQPRIKHRRQDKAPEECLMNQLTPSDTRTVIPL